MCVWGVCVFVILRPIQEYSTDLEIPRALDIDLFMAEAVSVL